MRRRKTGRIDFGRGQGFGISQAHDHARGTNGHGRRDRRRKPPKGNATDEGAWDGRTADRTPFIADALLPERFVNDLDTKGLTGSRLPRPLPVRFTNTLSCAVRVLPLTCRYAGA